MNICVAIILVGISYIIISPVIAIISRAFMHEVDLTNPMIFLIPINFTLDNIRTAWFHMDYVTSLTRTLVFSVGLGVLHVLVAAAVGYGFARFKVPGANVLFALLVVTIVVPVQTYMVPLWMQFRFFTLIPFVELNLIGSFWPIVIITIFGVGMRSGLFIFIFRQFFRGLPKEIEEAALIDGAGIFRTFFRVMLPNAKPPIITVLLFAFVWHYNDVFYTSMLAPGSRLIGMRMTNLEFAIRIGGEVIDHGWESLILYAGVFLVIAPIVAIYFLMQRYFVEGIERSGIVG